MQEWVCKAYPSFLKAGLKKENLLFSVSCRQSSKSGMFLIKEYCPCSCCRVLMENIKLCLWFIRPGGCGCTVEWRWLSKKRKDMSSAENLMEISSISQKHELFVKGLGLIVSIFRIPWREKSFMSCSLSSLMIKLWLIVYTVHLNSGMG